MKTKCIATYENEMSSSQMDEFRIININFDSMSLLDRKLLLFY